MKFIVKKDEQNYWLRLYEPMFAYECQVRTKKDPNAPVETIYLPTMRSFYDLGTVALGGKWGAPMYWLGKSIVDLWYADGSPKDEDAVSKFLSTHVSDRLPGFGCHFNLDKIGSITGFVTKCCTNIRLSNPPKVRPLPPKTRVSADSGLEDDLIPADSKLNCLVRYAQYENYYTSNYYNNQAIYAVNCFKDNGKTIYFPSARTIIGGRNSLSSLASDWGWTLDVLINNEGYPKKDSVSLPKLRPISGFLTDLSFDLPVKVLSTYTESTLIRHFKHDLTLLSSPDNVPILKSADLHYDEASMSEFVDTIASSSKILEYKNRSVAQQVFLDMLNVLVTKRHATPTKPTYEYIARVLSHSSYGFWYRMTQI